MERGDIVKNSYHAIERYGIVKTAETKSDGWKHVTVDWINDEKYERAMAWRKKLNNKIDYYLKEYRCDQLKKIAPEEVDKLVETLLEAKKQHHERQSS